MVKTNPIDTTLRQALALSYARMGLRDKLILELRRLEAFQPKDRTAIAALFLNYRALDDKLKISEYEKKLKDLGTDPSIFDGVSTATQDSMKLAMLPPDQVLKLRPATSGIATVVSSASNRVGNVQTTVPLPVATISVPISATIPLADSQKTTPVLKSETIMTQSASPSLAGPSGAPPPHSRPVSLGLAPSLSPNPVPPAPALPSVGTTVTDLIPATVDSPATSVSR
jgi:hypothetical protein